MGLRLLAEKTGKDYGILALPDGSFRRMRFWSTIDSFLQIEDIREDALVR